MIMTPPYLISLAARPEFIRSVSNLYCSFNKDKVIYYLKVFVDNVNGFTLGIKPNWKKNKEITK